MSSSNENLGADPSMEEILSSIRRILKEDERIPPGGEAPPNPVVPNLGTPNLGAPNLGTPSAPAPQRMEAGQNAQRTEAAQPQDEESDSVLVLDPSMMVPQAPGAFSAPAPSSAPIRPAAPQALPPQMPRPAVQTPRPTAPATVSAQPPNELLGESAAESASSHLGALMRKIPLDRAAAVSHGGPTLEDIVRDELRPQLRGWLDANLPALVERIVRAEIERLVARTNS